MNKANEIATRILNNINAGDVTRVSRTQWAIVRKFATGDLVGINEDGTQVLLHDRPTLVAFIEAARA